MPKYFFDTSALAKLYHQEAGGDLVDRIVSEPDSQHLISRLTIVEMESVFALKAPIGEIDQRAVLIARRRVEADLGRRRLLVAAVNDEHFRGARQLLFKYGAIEALRTLLMRSTRESIAGVKLYNRGRARDDLSCTFHTR